MTYNLSLAAQIILENLHSRWHYLVRDDYGELYVTTNQPKFDFFGRVYVTEGNMLGMQQFDNGAFDCVKYGSVIAIETLTFKSFYK